MARAAVAVETAPHARERRVLTSQAFFEGERGNARDFLYRSLGSEARRVTMRLEDAGAGLRGFLEVVLAA